MSQPTSVGQHPVTLLLHGWTGDENSMWVFVPRLPVKRLFIAPRGLYPATRGGFSWHAPVDAWPNLEHFDPVVEALLEFLSPARFPIADFSELHLVGFSQGAALAYALTILHPERVASLSALSGFLPGGVTLQAVRQPMSGLPVFITHGTQDTLVPVDQARQAVDLFTNTGARVTYCEHDVGHKLSADCFRGLEVFHQHLNG